MLRLDIRTLPDGSLRGSVLMIDGEVRKDVRLEVRSTMYETVILVNDERPPDGTEVYVNDELKARDMGEEATRRWLATLESLRPGPAPVVIRVGETPGAAMGRLLGAIERDLRDRPEQG